MQQYETDEYNTTPEIRGDDYIRYDQESYDSDISTDNELSRSLPIPTDEPLRIPSLSRQIPQNTLELASPSYPIINPETFDDSGDNTITFPYAPVSYPLSDDFNREQFIQDENGESLRSTYNVDSTEYNRSSETEGDRGMAKDKYDNRSPLQFTSNGLGLGGGDGFIKNELEEPGLVDGIGRGDRGEGESEGYGNTSINSSDLHKPGTSDNLITPKTSTVNHDTFKPKTFKRKTLSLAEFPDIIKSNKKLKTELNNSSHKDNDNNKTIAPNILNKLSFNLLNDLKDLNLIFKSTLTDHQLTKHVRRGSACNVSIIVSGLSHFDENMTQKIGKKIEDSLLDYSVAAKDIVVFQNPSFDPKYHQTYLNTVGFIHNAISTQQASSLSDILSLVADQISVQYHDLYKQFKSKPTQYENNSDFLPAFM